MSNSAVKPYPAVKRELLDRDLFSCSQVGFNIAMGPLAGLRRELAALIRRLYSPAVEWSVPPMIRADWVPGGAWINPCASQWVRLAPGDHIMTPLPLMHLLNRYRHHPESGTTHLESVCFRQEEDTLPLLRQTAFLVHEHVSFKKNAADSSDIQDVFSALAVIANRLSLPVEQPDPGSANGRKLLLTLPETPPVALVSERKVSPELLNAYQLAGSSVVAVSTGIERWCLAVVAGFGADPDNWPDLTRLVEAD